MYALFDAAIVMVVLAAESGPGLSPATVFETAQEPVAHNKIDELVFARWQQQKIEPAHVCSDATFVRRVFLDVIGTLPTAREATEFLKDHDPDKRGKLIDRLLQRPEYAEYWGMKWADVLRIKAEFPINLWPNAVQAYHRWVCDALRDNMPYDQFVRALLTSSGSNFRVPPVNFYRAIQGKDPQAITRAAALTLLGERADKWPAERRDGMAQFFSYVGFKLTKEWKEEIVYFDLEKAIEQSAHKHPQAIFPDGTHVVLTLDTDPRIVFADWLVQPEHPQLGNAIVNRIWYWLLGRGIVHQPDDFRPDNPPSNPELLDYLRQELIASHYDLKHIYRLILNSATYQLASIPRSKNPRAVACFAYYPVRRLDAEVLADALCQITGTSEKYSSAIPEPFTFIPETSRSITLADGSTTSAFLEMFCRPPRDSGLESERNNKPTAAQRLHLLNSSHVQRKLMQGRKVRRLIDANRSLEQTVEQLYLLILSRYPTPKEVRTISAYAQSGVVQRRQSLEDLTWALVNSAEFLYRH